MASAMLALMEDANTPVEPDSLPGGAEPRGQHGCRESVLRALSDMGMPLDRVRLSAITSGEAASNEVHIYVR